MVTTMAELAEARCRAYGLFSTLALQGLTETTVDLIDAVPALAAAAQAWLVDGELDIEAAAAAHYDVLAHDVFPYRSVFVAEDGCPGGPETERVAAWYAQIGCASGRGPSADHIGLLLRAMAFLCGAEADARADDRPDVGARVATLQTTLLDEFVLPWWPALAEAVVANGVPFYAAWAEAVSELILHHRGDLGPAESDEEPAGRPFSATEGSLAEVCTGLLVATRTGALLTRRALREVGRAERVPGGFGPRRTILMNLFRSAQTYHRLDPLLQRLEARFAEAQRYYVSYADRAPPAAGRWAIRWAERTARTTAALAEMRRSASLHKETVRT